MPPVPFDLEEIFGPDYLHFHADYLTDAQAEADVEEICSRLAVTEGRLLDAPCGTGRLAHRLALLGYDVVGVDRCEAFIEMGRSQAHGLAAATLDVGDLRNLEVQGPFDAVVCWFNSFGYFDDATNRSILDRFSHLLGPGGQLLIDTLHHDGVVHSLEAGGTTAVVERGPDVLIDRSQFNPLLGRLETARRVLRDGQVRRSNYFVRLPTLVEWTTWLEAAGFSEVAFSDRDGAEVQMETVELVIDARV